MQNANDTMTNFTFFGSFKTAMRFLKTDEEKFRYLMMIIDYGLNGIEPPPSDDDVYAIFSMNALHVLKKGRRLRMKAQRQNERRSMRNKSDI